MLRDAQQTSALYDVACADKCSTLRRKCYYYFRARYYFTIHGSISFGRCTSTSTQDFDTQMSR